jgi:hypothetical protein
MISSPRARLEASLLLDSLAVHRPKRVNSSHGVTKTGAEGRSAPRLASSRRPDGAGRLMNGSFLAERHSAHRPLFSSLDHQLGCAVTADASPVGLRGRTRARGGGARGWSEEALGLPLRLAVRDQDGFRLGAGRACPARTLAPRLGRARPPTRHPPARLETAWLDRLRHDPFIPSEGGRVRPGLGQE